MSAPLDLYVRTDSAELTADLRLQDAASTHLAWRQVRLKDHPASRWEGLFDLRRYVRRYAGNVHPLNEGVPLDETGLVRELGVFLGREVLGGGEPDPGRNILTRLGTGFDQRTVRVRLPGADQQTDHLAAAFARVPWEIARLDPQGPTLAEKNVLIRALTGEHETHPGPLVLQPNELLRVLLVFAEAPGSRPLAARLERQRLLELFHRRICPWRRVAVDVLCHGVTRERLIKQINRKRGYHVVHWSGHGHLNLLELYSENKGEPSRLTGQELVRLFAEAGGYVPRLFFLSACHSGNFLNLRDWAAFQAVLDGREPDEKGAEGEAAGALDKQLEDRPGYTGTAHALLEAHVPTVVAMRYEVGDDYSRDLATAFYEHLLADEQPKRPDESLNQARGQLLQAAQQDASLNYAACDHATPVLYGAADPGLTLSKGSTSPPVTHPDLRIKELHAHRDFVGRTWELARLGARWLEAEGRRPVAVIRGLGGLGKTALAAEAIDLWHGRFRWVFAFQAKPVALPLDEFLRHLHTTWMDQQGDYAQHVAQYPAEAVWRPAADEFTGTRRQETLRVNLVRALVQEPVLLVLDNFERCLIDRPAAGGAGHACQDPGWDALLAALADGLIGSNSRVLLTCRWPLAALAGPAPVEDLLLGPLPPGEAALYVRGHAVLRKLYFEEGGAGRTLVMRLLQASRGHPLLLDRLARLAELDRKALEGAFERLEKEGLAQLPQFFAANPRDKDERRYLEDALAGSIDLLLEQVGPDARRLLWVLSLANEPISANLWRGVWEGRDVEDEQLEQLRQLLALVEQLPPEARGKLPPLSEELKAQLTALAARGPDAPPVPDFEPLQRTLVQTGLVTEGRDGEADEGPEYTCHELVRERVAAWSAIRVAETGGRTREHVWAAYGDRFVLAYKQLVHSNQQAAALEAGGCALRYVVRAGAFEKLGEFASRLITSTNDPSVLRALLPELEHAATAAPPGKKRWSTRTYLADAFRQGGQPDASLPHFVAAAAEAEQAQAWDDLAWITGNWAHALADCGQLAASREKFWESARLKGIAGRPAVDVLGSEMEALRVDVQLGRAEEALPEVESRLARIRAWWERSQRGEAVPEAPDPAYLGHVFGGALDIAQGSHRALEQWQAALDRIAEIIAVNRVRGESEHEMARDRFNRYAPLVRLGQLDEAQRELEYCLEVFEAAGERAKVLSGLAQVFDKKGDLGQAIALQRRALALRNTQPEPVDRAISHNNLGNSLISAGHLSDAAAHELAALLYFVAIGHGQHIQTVARNHVVRLRRARQSGGEHKLPRVAELVARPDFAALRDWLTAAQVDLEQLQEAVDAFTARCRQMAEQALAEEETS
jgi:tetratricopeptide (TPR) repeat protein